METFETLPEPSLSESISSPVDSPAKISAKPASGQVSKALAAAFGLSSPVLLGNLDPDSFLLKTSQASLFQEQCPEWSESWPDLGMWESGAVYELQSSALRTSESACSSSRTLTDRHYKPHDLVTATDTWRTPDAPGSGGPRNRQRSIGNGHQVTIAEQAEHWGTPNAHPRTFDPRQVDSGIQLANQVDQWQTPATDSFPSRGGDRKDEMGLDQQARHFPSPAARDYRTPNKLSYRDRGGSTKGEQLQNFVEHRFPSPPDLPTNDGQPSSPNTPTSPRRLNPRFVEWLMGFPIGWSEL